MRHSRVYIEQPLMVGESALLDTRAAHYLTRVLRLAAGDELILFNGDGRDYSAELRRDGKGLSARVTGSSKPNHESPLAITLVQAIGRGERMDYALQKATELGVTRIQPISTERVAVRLGGDKLAKRQEHWRGVVISACEQSGRAVVPEIAPLLTLRQWLLETDGLCRLVLDPAAAEPLSAVCLDGAPVAVVIGPEGGFSTPELKEMRASGVRPVMLGPRVLRTESAGPAAIAVLQAMAGDFRPR